VPIITIEPRQGKSDALTFCNLLSGTQLIEAANSRLSNRVYRRR
jgi:hypothetical protein